MAIQNQNSKLQFFIKPLSVTMGIPRWMVFSLALLGLIYVLNPTIGIFELLPDNLPIVGNLDEGAAYILVWMGIVEAVEGKKGK